MDFTSLANIFIHIFMGTIVWKGCESQNDEKCFKEYESEEEYKTGGNVVYVCTNTTTPEYTDTVYMDTAKIPRSVTSTCSCVVTFAGNGPHSVRIDYKYEDSTKYSLLVEGFLTDFSIRDESKNLDTSTQKNRINFIANSTNTNQIDACLRLSLRVTETSSNSPFKVACFTQGGSSSGQSSQSSPSSTTNSQTSDTSRGSTQQDDSTGPGSTASPIRGTTDESNGGGISGVVIGAAAGGAVVIIIILVVVVVIVILRKRKSKLEEGENYDTTENAMKRKSKLEQEQDYDTTENALYGKVIKHQNQKRKKQKVKVEDDYDITENAMYGVTKQQDKERKPSYDEITPDDLKHQSVIYSVVDKDNVTIKNGGVTKQADQDDEYNHLNAMPRSIVTGNIYSSIGRRGSQPAANIYNSVSASQKSFGSQDNIYNTSQES